jgi:hypothetical protein
MTRSTVCRSRCACSERSRRLDSALDTGILAPPAARPRHPGGQLHPPEADLEPTGFARPASPTARYSTAQHGACWCCVLGEGGYRWRFVPMEGRASPTRAAPHATGSPCSGFASARMWKELESASSRPWDAHDAVPLAPPRTRFPNGTRLTRQTSGPVPVKCTSVVSGVRLSNSVSLTRAVPF